MSTPPVIAHRGAASLAPENTLAAFRKAAELGAAWVELDCQLSADAIPMVMHDTVLRRTTSGRGLVRRHTAENLRRLDAGAWFAAEFRNERIPTLAEALAEIARLGLGVNIEIKPSRGQDEDTARLAMRVAAEAWPASAPPPLVSSFSRASLAVARAERPQWPRGLLVGKLPRDWREALRALGCSTINVDRRRLTATRVTALRAAGYAVLAYTVNDPACARELWRWGVASVFTDVPQQLVPLVKEVWP